MIMKTKRLSISMIACIIAMLFIANTSANANDETNKSKPIPEVMPQFVGGQEAMIEFFSKNVNYPKELAEKGVCGRVICSLIIDEEGRVGNVKVARSVHPQLDKEAVRVIEAMPAWKPAKQDGKAVSSEMYLPIFFKR